MLGRIRFARARFGRGRTLPRAGVSPGPDPTQGTLVRATTSLFFSTWHRVGVSATAGTLARVGVDALRSTIARRVGPSATAATLARAGVDPLRSTIAKR